MNDPIDPQMLDDELSMVGIIDLEEDLGFEMRERNKFIKKVMSVARKQKKPIS